MGILKAKTLTLVRDALQRRQLRRMAMGTGIPYATLHYMATAKDDVKIDADHCETIYQYTTGKTLNLVDYV